MNKKYFTVLILSMLLISACTSSTEEKDNQDIQTVETIAEAMPTVESVAEVSPTVETVTESPDEQLFKAIIAHDFAVAKQALEAGANPDAINSAGVPALLRAIRAAKSGDTEIVELLLEFGADANGLDKDGNPMLPQVAGAGNVEDVQLLLDAGADVNATMTLKAPNGTILSQAPAIMHAAVGNNIEVVKLLIANGANLNQTDAGYKDTALHGAAWLNQAEIVKILLDSGAEPNPVNIYSESPTPLYYAIENRSFEAFQALVEGGVDVDFQSDRGLTPLMSIIKGSGSARMVEMVDVLLDAGADPNIQDDSGNTALHHAAQWKQSEIIPLLIEGGAVLDMENNFGLTALDIATNLGDEEIAEILREAGAKE